MYSKSYFSLFTKNGVAEIERLAKFLEVDADDELVSAINEKCSFKSLAAGKEDVPSVMVKNNYSFFRKGKNTCIHVYIVLLFVQFVSPTALSLMFS